MSLTYTTYTAQLANIMVVGSTDANFQVFLPGAIDYAEGRMYRELDLLVTRVTDATTSVSSGNRNFTLPTTSGTYRVVEQVNLISPAATASSLGTRNPLTMVSKEVIDSVYPSNLSITGMPMWCAMGSNTSLIMGPAPSAAYVAEVVGTIQPTALSSTNTTTFLTTMLPDAFIAASMVFASGYMRDFGAQSDDPRMSQSWEAQYNNLLQSAAVETMRAKYQSQAWTSQIPAPVATPPRV